MVTGEHFGQLPDLVLILPPDLITIQSPAQGLSLWSLPPLLLHCKQTQIPIYCIEQKRYDMRIEV